MKSEYSKHSMLRGGLPSEEVPIDCIISTTERHIRAMCRVMQIYEQNACDTLHNLKADYLDLTAVFAAFYDYIDCKMDVLKELSDALETGIKEVSIAKLRASDDFRLKPLPREAFTSDENFLVHKIEQERLRKANTAVDR